MSDPIRVLMVIGKMDRGGAETIVMNLYRNINRNRVQFDFAVHTYDKGDYDDEILALGGRIFYFPQYKVYNEIIYRKKWNEFFKTHGSEFKFVHGHIGSCATIYLSEAKKFGIKTIAHSHSCMNGLYGKCFKILSFPQRYIADWFLGCSDEAGIDRFGKKVVSNYKIYKTLSNGIDAKAYIYNPKIRNEYRKRFNVDDKLVIGHIGRFTYAKNHKFLIDVFKEIRKMREDSVLALVGRGELETEIREYVEKAGVSDSVIFGGVRSDISDFLQMYDVFVFPSIYEGLGIALVEAQAAGLPCIISDIIPSIACVTPNCKKLPLNDSPKAWAAEIIDMYEKTDRTNTYEYIKKSGFDIESVAQKLEDFYVTEEF